MKTASGEEDSGKWDPEFWKEIMMLSVYKHENIVSLLGYCADCGEKVLMYEYLPKKSLDRGISRAILDFQNLGLPLYAETGLLTKESDVYSFGVVLCEVLCGRLCIVDDKLQPLVGLARQSFRQNTVNQIVLTNIRDELNPSSLDVFSKVAYQCLKLERDERPLIMEIVRGLETAFQCQGDEIILVYEYIHNGSLNDHLHQLGTPLSWLQRLNICIDTDESWTAKIADLGLATIVPRNQTYVMLG
ncbi:kinase-like domain, phloem protein 2-like protein [Tanacetum coccineum]